ncbi:hypothetical protein K2173_010244 [Erythroxylum novogranatense]|uniref:Proline-rich protein 3-like n=1 Tax=Erythroxylum novogranatense TaxID=1862640 RepID=A0AAV8U9J2_9ROSI|nr:hypothetical protein K2173_010244 [Erythroxylum novogranatense]
MALNRVFLAISVLLLPLSVNSARYYGYGTGTDSAKSNYPPAQGPAAPYTVKANNEPTSYTVQQKNAPRHKQDEVKQDYNSKPSSDEDKPDVVKSDYSPKTSPEYVKPGYMSNPTPEVAKPHYSAIPKPFVVKLDDIPKSKPDVDVVKPNYSSNPTPDVTKPYNIPSTKSGTAKPTYNPKPKPDVAKPNPQPKPETEKPNYTLSPNPDAVESETVKPAYYPNSKPDATKIDKYPSSKPDIAKTDYNSKPERKIPQPQQESLSSTPRNTKPNEELKQESSGVAPHHGSGPKPDIGLKVTVPKLDNGVSNYGDVPEAESSLPIGIEGLVLCKSGSDYVPIQGAVARIACSTVDQNGYEATPFSCLTGETDAKGYFFRTLSLSGLDDKLQLKDCKAFLERSPLDTCKLPTDVNKGITGALLSTYRVLAEKKIKLFSVGPFFYTSEPASAPGRY